MTDELDQEAADRRVAAFVAEMRMRGFSDRQVWVALLSHGAHLGRRDVGHKTLAARLRMLAYDLTMQVVQTPQRQHGTLDAPIRWRDWARDGEANDN